MLSARQAPRIVAALAAVAALGTTPATATAPVARPATEHVVASSRPFDLGGFQTLLPKVDVPAPHRDGYVTRMSAELQYASGRRVPIQRVMLHHLVFLASGQGAGRTSCDGRAGEPFYGTGEEHQKLVLPDGYGYRVQPHMRWRMQAMLMSHSAEYQQVRVVYRYTIVTGRALTPVKPLWLRANGCTPNPSYDITGGGAPGSVHVKTHDWTLPLSGRIVAVGSHLHGSAYGMKIAEPSCGGRTIVRNRARYGNPHDRVYQLRPTLHEPGPISTGYWMSKAGLPVAKGEVLRVTAAYDAQYPHPQVMAIDHLYIAPDASAARTPCAPLPADRHIRWERHDGSFHFPRVVVPLTRLTGTGAVVPVDRPPGPETILTGRRATIPLKDALFGSPNVSIQAGTTLTWQWLDRGVDHNVLLASGPRNVSSPTRGYGATFKRRFDTPGTYRLFCYLHPVTMQEVVTVRTPSGAVPADVYAGATGRPVWPAPADRPDPPASRANARKAP